MSIRPGTPTRGSKTGRPVMILLDVLGRRWTLRVLWELREGAAGFRELRELCGNLSPTILSRRLTELNDLGIVETDEAGRYRLSKAGKSMLQLLAPLQAWSDAWAAGLRGK